MIPAKLQPGDEVRIISPAESMEIIAPDQQKLAVTRLRKSGLEVSFSKHVSDKAPLLATSIDHRVQDIHDAFLDPAVKAVLTTIGGFESNQLLRYINYDIIRKNPKIFCGYSDITVLSNAFYQKAGLVTYSGPHFSTFGMEKGLEYTLEYFEKAFFTDDSYTIPQAETWSDDSWFIDQEKRTFHKNHGYKVINEGKTTGRTIGGNLCSLNLLQGTEYMPSLKEAVVFVEDDYMSIPETFDRDLQSLIHQPSFQEAKGLVVGRFQEKSGMTMELLEEIIRTKKELDHLPVIVNASFGHTTPQFTFPIGGRVTLEADREGAFIKIIEH
ncbi:LD-carboxypeptidase [Halobacillus salinarum]|uniref:LD-carboxypeptidase n=1 Tax=Halobacillus salinarum TaxID=2932257 RepID=A0ABY4EJ63_9BACI|nr:S66 peptidase family protein [Halobacillus salinarum]UOQ43562.1 LD-carboxypeptidase [Halobacillus salinarum]